MGAEVDAGEEALAEVATYDLFRSADGGEVRPRIPLEDEVEVGRELGVEVRPVGFGRGVCDVRGEESGDGFGGQFRCQVLGAGYEA